MDHWLGIRQDSEPKFVSWDWAWSMGSNYEFMGWEVMIWAPLMAFFCCNVKKESFFIFLAICVACLVAPKI